MQDNYENWKSILFNKREFRESDRVCERHFDRDQILTHWEHLINGEVAVLEREKPKIKANAIPHLNLPDTEDVAQITAQKRTHKEPKKRKQNLTNKVSGALFEATFLTRLPVIQTHTCSEIGYQKRER